jgi:C4-dicarboxylate-specific signal transduction histidine kinase
MATVSAARRRAEDSLEKAREGLEARVRERTADVERSNARLQAAVAEAVAAQAERQGTCGCSKASIASIAPLK